VTDPGPGAPDAADLAGEAAHLRLAAELLAHRLRNPLNSVVLVAEVLRRAARRGDGPALERSLDTLVAEARRMERLIEGFVQDVRGAPPAGERTDLAQVLDAAAELLRAPARDAGMGLRRQDPAGAVDVTGSPPRILRAALSAGLAMLTSPSPGGELKLSLDAGRGGPLLLFVGGVAPPDAASLALARTLAERCGARLEGPDGARGLALCFPVDPADPR
jgi:hypothetical protein